MINLFDYYTQETADLYDSLTRAGFNHPTVVIHDDGFIPKNIYSPYTYLLGEETGRPLYFNEVPVPKFWEIKSTNSVAEVYDFDRKCAVIRFATPSYQRFVKTVEWFDKKGNVMCVDHYNQHGRRFAQTVYTDNQEEFTTTYYHVDGSERVIENHQTKNIIVHTEKGLRLFQSKDEFVVYMLKDLQFDVSTIVYNTLANPFFITYQLTREGSDVLFWQEEIGESIPGNMSILLNEPYRSTKIVVQNKEVYEKLISKLEPEHHPKVTYLGLIYEFKRQNTQQATVLNFTNSDEILHLETLIQQLPNVQFKIGALTEMSSKLMALSEYPNVVLYPNIAPETITKLLNSCDIYADINYGNEILFATRQAFEHNMVLVGFQDTLHSRHFIARQHIINHNAEEMVQLINRLVMHENEITEALQRQQKDAYVSSVEDYQNFFRGIV